MIVSPIRLASEWRSLRRPTASTTSLVLNVSHLITGVVPALSLSAVIGACTNRYTDAKSILCRLSGCHTATVQPVFVLALHALCLGVATILITRPPVKGCDNSTHQFLYCLIGSSDGARADLGCPLTRPRNSNYLASFLRSSHLVGYVTQPRARSRCS